MRSDIRRIQGLNALGDRLGLDASSASSRSIRDAIATNFVDGTVTIAEILEFTHLWPHYPALADGIELACGGGCDNLLRALCGHKELLKRSRPTWLRLLHMAMERGFQEPVAAVEELLDAARRRFQSAGRRESSDVGELALIVNILSMSQLADRLRDLVSMARARSDGVLLLEAAILRFESGAKAVAEALARERHVLRREALLQSYCCAANVRDLKSLFHASLSDGRRHEAAILAEGLVAAGDDQTIQEIIEVMSAPRRTWAWPWRRHYDSLALQAINATMFLRELPPPLLEQVKAWARASDSIARASALLSLTLRRENPEQRRDMGVRVAASLVRESGSPYFIATFNGTICERDWHLLQPL